MRPGEIERSYGAMKPNPIQMPARSRGWPVKALAIWLIDATAIVVIALVMMAVNEFKEHPRGATAR
jgi:hypothetical protein